jgi:hypothetical protein
MSAHGLTAVLEQAPAEIEALLYGERTSLPEWLQLNAAALPLEPAVQPQLIAIGPTDI